MAWPRPQFRGGGGRGEVLSKASLDAKVGPEDGGHFPILGIRIDSWQGRGGHLKRELRTANSGGRIQAASE